MQDVQLTEAERKALQNLLAAICAPSDNHYWIPQSPAQCRVYERVLTKLEAR